MRIDHVLGLGATVALLGAGAWLGCASNSAPADRPSVIKPPNTLGSVDASTGDDAGDMSAGDASDDTSDDTPPTPDCTSYCTAIMASCTGAFGQATARAQYPASDVCANYCAALNAGNFGDLPGSDTLGCRVGALMGDAGPAASCDYAGPTGGGSCNDPTTSDGGDNGRCSTFCAATVALCAGANGVTMLPYATTDTCMAACTGEFQYSPLQPEFTESGNTLNCRQYYLQLGYATADGGANTPAVVNCPQLGFPSPRCK